MKQPIIMRLGQRCGVSRVSVLSLADRPSRSYWLAFSTDASRASDTAGAEWASRVGLPSFASEASREA